MKFTMTGRLNRKVMKASRLAVSYSMMRHLPDLPTRVMQIMTLTIR